MTIRRFICMKMTAYLANIVILTFILRLGLSKFWITATDTNWDTPWGSVLRGVWLGANPEGPSETKSTDALCIPVPVQGNGHRFFCRWPYSGSSPGRTDLFWYHPAVLWIRRWDMIFHHLFQHWIFEICL